MKTKSYRFASVLANEFADYLALRESQGHQHLKEKYYFKLLDQYLCAHSVTDKELTAPIIEGWIQSLPSEMSVNTKIVYISHYSQFAKYLSTLNITAFIPERPIEDNSYTPYVFSESEMEKIFLTADNIAVGTRSHRFAAQEFPLIIRILYGCGLRLNEALSLQVGDIDLQTGVLLIRNAKGNKDRLVPMEASLSDILHRYITIYRANDTRDSFLFQNRKGERYSQVITRAWFNLTLEKAGISQPASPKYSRSICPHCLRHSFAVSSFRKQDIAGVDMYTAAPFLSTYMGHDRILGTETYLHMTAENSADVIKQMTAYAEGLFPEVPQ